jgi:hypothetical protein
VFETQPREGGTGTTRARSGSIELRQQGDFALACRVDFGIATVAVAARCLRNAPGQFLRGRQPRKDRVRRGARLRRRGARLSKADPQTLLRGRLLVQVTAARAPGRLRRRRCLLRMGIKTLRENEAILRYSVYRNSFFVLC